MKIVTHNGKFHADDVMAVAILSFIYNVEIVRTRHLELIDTEYIAVDVGGGGYDHHMSGGNGSHDNGTPYAAAGLVWRDFGVKYISRLISGQVHQINAENTPHLDEIIAETHQQVEIRLMIPIDAVDNGIGISADTSFSSTISSFNACGVFMEDENALFMQAMYYAAKVLDRAILNAFNIIVSRKEVQMAIEATRGHVMVIENPVPWIETLAESDRPDILFVVKPGKDRWDVQTVPKIAGQFGARKDLPASWGGLDGH